MKILNKKAISIIEYSLLFIIIAGAFIMMQNYIQRGVYNMWGQSGQSLAYGRQYDSQKTADCAFDSQSGHWYDHNCYEDYVHYNKCEQKVNPQTCEEKIMIGNTCQASTCNELNNSVSMYYDGG